MFRRILKLPINWGYWFIIMGMLGLTFGLLVPLPRNDGDAGPGLRVKTDALTGCQYLQVNSTGLTPRLDADGRHICRTP
jgi:hypothetical protein